jgi:hypothetical protein
MSWQWLLRVGHLGHEAWQWLLKPASTPLSTIVTAAVVAFISYLLGKRGARTARNQERLADAYPPVVDLTIKLTRWATFTQSPLLTGAEPPRPGPPDIAETIACRRGLYTFGTPRVQTLFEQFMKCVFAVEDMEDRVAHEQQARSRHESSGTWDPRDGIRALNETLKPTVAAAQDQLQAAIRAELRRAKP